LQVSAQSLTAAEPGRKFALSIASDLAGRVWVGTENGGIWCYSPTSPAGQQWTRFTTADGLGDNTALALACDCQGRIWVGHAAHGVSVFNGERWAHYDIVGGAEKPGSLSGPMGDHVVAIKVCPTNGDVWMATNAGLTRYSESTDCWTDYTPAGSGEPGRTGSGELGRTGGLATNQVLAMAFDAAGNLYCATGADGLLILDAASGYSKSRQVNGPEAVAPVAQGSGLPTNLMTDVLVAHDGTIYAGTCAGLAWSRDGGASWQYVRGKDWADKVKQSADTPPNGWNSSQHGPLIDEDYVTCLAEDATGELLVGSRRHGWLTVSRNGDTIAPSPGTGPNVYVRCLPPKSCPYPVMATYGRGIALLNSSLTQFAIQSAESQSPPPLPTGAPPIDLAGLNRELSAMAQVPPSPDDAAPLIVALPDDWRTQGDWLGRYGRYWAIIASILSPGDGFDYLWGTGPTKPQHSLQMGPHRKGEDSNRFYIASLYGDDPRTLELPPVYLDSRIKHKLTTERLPRRQAEWNDAGFNYPLSWSGPDLYLQLAVPAGSFVMSVYAINDDGETGGPRALRDYEMVVKTGPDEPTIDLSDFDKSPTVATSRIHDFWSGVYKRFFVRGPCNVWVQVRRNYSDVAKLSGMMLDLADETPPPYFMTPQQWDEAQTRKLQRDNAQRQAFANSPATRAAQFAPQTSPADAAAAVLQHLDEMQNWNPRWWAINHRRLGVLLARWYEAQGHLTRPMLVQRATALYDAGLYDAWEADQTDMGHRPARYIERSLRWDGHSDYSSHGLATVTHYLDQAQTPPATQP
jgi:hypothetical protein